MVQKLKLSSEFSNLSSNGGHLNNGNNNMRKSNSNNINHTNFGNLHAGARENKSNRKNATNSFFQFNLWFLN